MRILAAFGLFLLAAPAPEIRYFHFQRPIQRANDSAGQTCLVVDPGVFAHSSYQLADIRLYQSAAASAPAETSYVVRSDVPVVSSDQVLSLLNLGKSGGETAFDVEMPAGRYSDLKLAVNGHDFLATVAVSGSQSQTAASRTSLGSFTIFDLSRQRLGRSTILHLPESDFRYLHFRIAGPVAPDDVTGVSVTRLPRSQPKFVAVAATASSTLKDRNSVIEFVVPAHTPVDRIVFVPGQNPASFSRDVEISATPVARPPANDAAEPPQTFTAAGNILRVHAIQEGHRIDEEHLSVEAPQVDFDGSAQWTVTIENHDDPPIQMNSVRLEMLARRLCFDATAGSAYALYYGDSSLGAPIYDYASLFVLQQNPLAAQLGPESGNPAYQPRPDQRPFTEKHPILLWGALILVIASLGVVALRSFKTVASKPS